MSLPTVSPPGFTSLAGAGIVPLCAPGVQADAGVGAGVGPAAWPVVAVTVMASVAVAAGGAVVAVGGAGAVVAVAGGGAVVLVAAGGGAVVGTAVGIVVGVASAPQPASNRPGSSSAATSSPRAFVRKWIILSFPPLA